MNYHCLFHKTRVTKAKFKKSVTLPTKVKSIKLKRLKQYCENENQHRRFEFVMPDCYFLLLKNRAVQAQQGTGIAVTESCLDLFVSVDWLIGKLDL